MKNINLALRRYQEEDEEKVINLWHRCNLVVPWNDPKQNIRLKLQVQPELFLVAVIETQVVAIIAFLCQRLFEKSKLILAPAIRNRGYTDETHLRGFERPNFWLVRAGGLCLCSSELYSPKTFQTSSQVRYRNPTPNPLPASEEGAMMYLM